jgi:hypothetical protein
MLTPLKGFVTFNNSPDFGTAFDKQNNKFRNTYNGS